MTQSNIINGFRTTGLYPWDPSTIPEVAFPLINLLPILTEIPIQKACNTSCIVDTPRRSLTNDTPNDNILSPVNRQDSDSNLTFCGETRELSPSLLLKNSELILERSPINISQKRTSDVRNLLIITLH